jgi:hypothetical protein
MFKAFAIAKWPYLVECKPRLFMRIMYAHYDFPIRDSHTVPKLCKDNTEIKS